MLRLTLRRKLLLFAALIAVVPLLVAGNTLIRIVQDELKSIANDQLLGVANEYTREINNFFDTAWLAPLTLIRNAVDDDGLGVEEKIALLTHGIADVPDMLALQITVAGAEVPLVVINDGFSEHLRAAGLDPLEVLRLSPERIAELQGAPTIYDQDPIFLKETGDWIATLVLPLVSGIGGAEATLSARVDMNRLGEMIRGDTLNRTGGSVRVVDRTGHELFGTDRKDLSDYTLVAEATGLLASKARSVTVAPYVRPDGEAVLGAYGFPRPFNCAVLAERPQRDAYLAVSRMTTSLLVWASFGLAVAIAGAFVLAVAISRPILEIDRVTRQVGRGNLAVRVVHGARLNDEIGGLARSINEMITGLGERLQLQKFVSAGTMTAIRMAKQRGVRLGGTRQRATMLFCDIRGYTAFAERHEPDVVVEVLNFYFQHLTDCVTRFRGDIDKFVGDQILAVFVGRTADADAVGCALAMQAKMVSLRRDRPDWDLAVGIGVHTGDVTMGAMGSLDRMDYTVLGDPVNLAARLCSHAGRGQTLISAVVHDAVAGVSTFFVEALEPIVVKGKAEPVAIYEVRAAPVQGEVAAGEASVAALERPAPA